MTIPRELQRSTPRPIALTPRGWWTIAGYCLNISLLFAVTAWLIAQPGHRTAAVATGPPAWLAWGWRTAAGILFAAVAGFVKIRRQSRLLMYGRATVARTTGNATPWWFRLLRTRARPRRLRCEYRLLSGGLCKTTVVTGDKKIPATDAEIVVLYDADEPEKATLYPVPAMKVNVA